MTDTSSPTEQVKTVAQELHTKATELIDYFENNARHIESTELKNVHKSLIQAEAWLRAELRKLKVI
jgi:hypothetical protein